MTSAVLLFFGATLIYTGFLALDRDLTIGLAAALVGLVLLVKPALDALRYWKTHFSAGQRPRPRGPKKEQKDQTKRTHLRVVKSEDDRPTIH
ncbi:MAG: hypothetical protein ABSE08_12355 [Syntrophobacteraceae bacterium]|jgi:hypothetical protein